MRGEQILKKCMAVLLVVSLFGLPAGGCGAKQVETAASNEGGTESTTDEVKIGMIFDTFVVERWIRDRDAFLTTAQDLGATVDITNANGSIERQEEMIRYYADNGFDAVVIVAIDSSPLVRAIRDARSKGVKIISYDRLIRMAGSDLYISFDNRGVGRLMAQAAADRLTQGDPVLLLLGPQSDNNTLLLEEGIMEVLNEKGLTVADRAYITDWDAEEASRYIEENLETVREVKGIICGNDNFAGSVIRTLSANRVDLPVITGQDADLDACQRIVEGTQTMTVYKPVHLLAQEAAKSAVALCTGEDVGAHETLNDGSVEVRTMLLAPQAVYASNMEDTIIESGFHTWDEVYLNVR